MKLKRTSAGHTTTIDINETYDAIAAALDILFNNSIPGDIVSVALVNDHNQIVTYKRVDTCKTCGQELPK